MKKALIIFSALVSIFVLSSCALDFGGDDRERVSITHTISKVTITDGNEVTLKEQVTEDFVVNPKVVAVLTLEVVDIMNAVGLDTFGIELFGLSKTNLPSYLSEYNDNKYPNVGTLFEVYGDALKAMMPDLIIIGGRSSTLYESLKADYAYADVLDVSNSNYDFEVQKSVFENLGKIFPSAKSTLDSYISQFEAEFDSIKSLSNGKDALFLLVNGAAISVFGAGSRYGALYDEFGFEPTDPNVGVTESHGNIVSYEYVSAQNPSYIFLMDRGVATGGSAATDQVVNNALIIEKNSVKDSKIIILHSYDC